MSAVYGPSIRTFRVTWFGPATTVTFTVGGSSTATRAGRHLATAARDRIEERLSELVMAVSSLVQARTCPRWDRSTPSSVRPARAPGPPERLFTRGASGAEHPVHEAVEG